MSRPGRWPEHDLIEREYPRRGRHWVAAQTGRSPAAVHAYAKRHGIELGDLPGYIRVSELAELTGRSVEVVWNRANADGVVRRLRASTERRGTFAAVVPLAWADEYVRLHAAQAEVTAVAEAEGWLTVKELAALWRVGKSTILRNLNADTGVLRPLLEGKRIRRGLGQHARGVWLMHPDDAHAVAARLDADRQRAKRLVSTKSLAIECGVGQAYAATIGKELGGELLFVHGRLMCHVTPETANLMRRRFAEGVTPGRRKGRPKKQTHPELKRSA